MRPRGRVVVGLATLVLVGVAAWGKAGEETEPVAGIAAEGPGEPEQGTPATAPAEDEGEPAGHFRWKDHRTVFESANARIELSHRVQFRFTYEDPGSGQRLSGTPGPGDGKGSFRIRRAKTTFDGWFLKPELRFELQLSWAGPEAGASTNTPLEDVSLTWDASKTGAFEITIGQYKVPLGRQEMSTSSGLQFVDRSILTFEFTRGRDMGVMVGGRLLNTKVEYRAGVFNGNAASQLMNANQKMQYNARVVFQPFGAVAYREGDLEFSRKPLLAIAGQFEHNDLRWATNANDLLTVIGGGDVVFRYRGLSLFGEYFYRDRTPEQGPSFVSPGFNVQAGYFIVPRRLEVALRYAGFDPSDAVEDNNRREKGVAVGYFIRGHNLKIQADFRQLEDDGLDRKSRELRVHTQFIF